MGGGFDVGRGCKSLPVCAYFMCICTCTYIHLDLWIRIYKSNCGGGEWNTPNMVHINQSSTSSRGDLLQLVKTLTDPSRSRSRPPTPVRKTVLYYFVESIPV